MSSFAVTVIVAAYGSLYVCTLSAFMFFVLCLLLRLLCFVYFIYVYCAFMSCLLVSFFRGLLCLRLQCLGELFACLCFLELAPSASAVPWWIFCLFTSSMTCSICVCYLLHLCLLCLGESSAPFASFMACSVCIYYLYLYCIIWCFVRSVYVSYTSVSYLFHLRFLWLALSTSTIYAICISLLCFGELSPLFTFSVVCSVYIYCLCLFCVFWCLVHFVCVCCAIISRLLRLRLL